MANLRFIKYIKNLSLCSFNCCVYDEDILPDIRFQLTSIFVTKLQSAPLMFLYGSQDGPSGYTIHILTKDGQR